MSTAILTIDDVASKNTPAIVDYLAEKGIAAVMFGVGLNMERDFDAVVYAVQNGIILGNHSYSHLAFSEETYEVCVEEIEKTEAVLDRVYSAAGVKRTVRPFRFPYGNKGDEMHGSPEHRARLQAYLKETGFSKLDDRAVDYPWYVAEACDTDRDTKWTFDFAEYRIRPGSGFTKADVHARIADENPQMGGSLVTGSHNIILLHAHDETEALAPRYYAAFLEDCLARGVRFVPPAFF